MDFLNIYVYLVSKRLNYTLFYKCEPPTTKGVESLVGGFVHSIFSADKHDILSAVLLLLPFLPSLLVKFTKI